MMLVSCGSESGDPHSNLGVPPPEGRDKRIRDIGDPTRPDHPKSSDSVAVSGAIVVAVDGFDETGNGKSRGTIYVQDVGSKAPFSGISLFAPSFIPGNLHVGPGDVLDLRGEYQENVNIGTAKFANGAVLPQLSRPVGTFRFESKTVEPTEIDVADLADYAVGRRWLGMLVKVKNVTVRAPVSREGLSNGRLNVDLLPKAAGPNACDAPFPKPPSLTNELADITTLGIPANTTVKSIVGVVTFFCNIHLSPRSVADVEL